MGDSYDGSATDIKTSLDYSARQFDIRYRDKHVKRCGVLFTRFLNDE